MQLLLSFLAALFTILPFALMGMAISTGVPFGRRTPSTAHTFSFSTAGAGLTPIAQTTALVGAMHTTGNAVADTPYRIWDAIDADTRFGAGSGLALMCRAFFKQCAKQGAIGPILYAAGLTPPGAGTAHAQTSTFGGAATAGGTGIVRIAGVPIQFAVTSGDAAATVATAFKAACDAKVAELPVTSGVVGAVVTHTHLTKGEVGADVKYELVQLPAGLTFASAVFAAGAGVTDPTAALTALRAFKIHGVAIENRKAADVTILKADAALAWGPFSKAWRHYYIGDASTLATADTLATGSNDYAVIVVQWEASPTLGGQLAAAAVAKFYSTDRPNANFNGQEIVGVPPADAAVYTTAELETALAAGTIPILPNAAKDAGVIVRAVTTKATTAGARDDGAYDLCASRTAAAIAEQCDITWQRDFTGLEAVFVSDPDDPDNTLDKATDMVKSVHRKYAALRPPVLRNVDEFIEQIRVEETPGVVGGLDFDNPFRVAGPINTADFRHRSYL